MATPVSSVPAGRRLGTFRALRHRNYRLYLIGPLASLTGSWVQPAALTWPAYEMTKQSVWPTPARLAFVMDMVGRDDLLNAVALNSLVFNVARAVGPAVCAQLLPLLGPGPCFLLNGLTFLAVLAALLAMRLPPPAAVPHDVRS